MVAVSNNQEATTTLHLGVRSVVDGSPESALSLFLSTASAQEKAAFEAISKGDGSSAMIFIHRGPAKSSRFLIEGEETSVGRSPESAVFLDDVTVSRLHAVIKKSADGFTLVDQASLNGTYVNNASISQLLLSNGDEVQIGKFHMIFVHAVKDSHSHATGEK